MAEHPRQNSTASRASLQPNTNTPPADSKTPQHKRVYQACIPCRRRKVRCDLGSVDDPEDPPCQRCRRESKECYFSATRRKRKGDDDIDVDGNPTDEYIVRNGRKRTFTRSPPAERPPLGEASAGPGRRWEPLRRPEPARSSIASTGRGSTGSRPSDFVASVPDDSDAQLENMEAMNVMRRGVYGTHDALDLLYKAATDGCVCPVPAARFWSLDCAMWANSFLDIGQMR